MSADMTSQEDLDDVAFRALLAPLALEVLPVPPGLGTADAEHPAAERAPDGQPPLQAVFPAPSVSPIVPEDCPASLPGDSAAQGVAVIQQHCPPSQAGKPTSSPPIAEHGVPTFAVPLAHLMRSRQEIQSDRQLMPSASGPPLTVSLVPGMLAEHGASRLASPPDPTTPGSEVLPGDWSLPDLAAPTSGGLPEDWSIPPEFASDLPFGLPPEEQEDRPLPSTGHFASLGSGMLPAGRWRFTVAIPGHLRESQSPADGAPALSAPPAAELSPGRSPATTVALGIARPNMSPRLVARAGAARDAVVVPVGRTQLVARKPALPPARVRWSVVLLAGAASAFTVACMSWLFDPPSPVDTGVAALSDVASATPASSGPVATRSFALAPDSGRTSSPLVDATSQPGPAPTAMSSPVPPTALGSPEASQRATPSKAAPAAPSAVAAPKLNQPTPSPQAMIALLTQRGDAAFAVGDITAARLLYERAAAMGSAAAATAVGKTYDLEFLLRADTHGIQPDSVAAAAWYRKAAALGDPEARTLLGRFEMQGR
jgi:hypothetical protein